mmetsp:Transcript_19520/g.61386  ORF Transcript_19520/g.61386 Transcript_19520/m.61386 type:complete len:221 (-) Transcript_19520:473-1135(-)
MVPPPRRLVSDPELVLLRLRLGGANWGVRIRDPPADPPDRPRLLRQRLARHRGRLGRLVRALRPRHPPRRPPRHVLRLLLARDRWRRAPLRLLRHGLRIAQRHPLPHRRPHPPRHALPALLPGLEPPHLKRRRRLRDLPRRRRPHGQPRRQLQPFLLQQQRLALHRYRHLLHRRRPRLHDLLGLLQHPVHQGRPRRPDPGRRQRPRRRPHEQNPHRPTSR